MTKKWTRSRSELIDIGAHLAHRGYSIRSVAAEMVRKHFLGRDDKSAERRLARAISERFWTRYYGRTEQQQTIADMANALYAEGWKPLFADDCEQCFWIHEATHNMVNCNGGYFRTYAAGTRAAYESATRALLLGGVAP